MDISKILLLCILCILVILILNKCFNFEFLNNNLLLKFYKKIFIFT